MYKLIAIDLDGTLLNSTKHISDENKKAIQHAIDQGVKVVVCSGRVFSGARVFAKEINALGPLIACNGAIIRDVGQEKLLHSNSMNLEDCKKVVDLCHKEDIYFHAYIGDTMYSEKFEHSTMFYMKKNEKLPVEDRIGIELVDDLAKIFEANGIPASKFVVISDDAKQLARARRFMEQLGSVKVMSSNYNNFEVVDRHVNKGNALKFISKMLNISREEVIAIGDNENDYSMIEYAGLGIAMGNAENIIKEIADYITLSNDEHGVSHAIYRYVL